MKPFKPNKGFSKLIRLSGFSKDGLGNIAGPFRSREGSFGSISGRASFMGLLRLFRPRGGSFRGPPGLLGLFRLPGPSGPF